MTLPSFAFAAVMVHVLAAIAIYIHWLFWY